MQRLSQEKIREICRSREGVTEVHIREHERLMAEHFLENPHLPKTAEDRSRIAERERQLHDLHELIYAPKPSAK
jgi:hypothetical protein